MLRSETDQKYEKLIADCDLMIKSGKIDQVVAVISDLVIAQIPRFARHGLAKCCRRVGLLSVGLRLLHPIIRGVKILEEPVSANEVCEYAALLARNGSVDEALELLKGVNSISAPEALLYRGQAHIQKWDYAQAVTCFEKYLTSTADDYSKLIARVNLISGYIVLLNLDQATEMLRETVGLAEKAGAARLLANCYELWGQIHFWRGDFTRARGSLAQASAVFNNSVSPDQLLVMKTESIMQAFEQKSVAPIAAFRQQAALRKNWESVREADLFILKSAPNQRQLDHLIFGTPHAAYRERIEKIVGASASPSYVLGDEEGLLLNLQTGIVNDGPSLRIGKKVHQVISSLNRDFYAPINMGTLFHELYPDEYFDIDSSPFRIRQAILRTRQWLESNQIPAMVEQSHGAYRFVITGKFGIKLWGEQREVNPTVTRWQQLSTSLAPGCSFTSEDACRALGWSRTTFRRLAEWGCESGRLRRFGTGKSTTYQIIDPTIGKKAAA